MTLIEKLRSQINDATIEYNDAVARQLDPSTIRAAGDKLKTLRERYAAAQNDKNMQGEIDRLTGGMPAAGSGLGAEVARTLGAWLNANRGQLPENFQSPVFDLHATTLDESSGSGGPLVISDYQSGIVTPLPRPLVVADLLAPGTTTSNSITYMTETTFTNAAAPVAEGTTKPESTLVFTQTMDPVRKIAHWIPLTDEILSDVPQMQSYVETRMRTGLQLAEDDQLLSGNGTAPNFTGLLNRPGLATAIARGADTNVDAIGKQIAAIETATNLQVDGVILHPTNWLTILQMKDTTGNYMANGGPFASPVRPRLWGKNIALTTAIPVNTALVGAFKIAAQFFRNGGIRIDLSNSHMDFFVKNLLALRTEERGALAVYRAAAMGKVTGLS